MKSFNKRVIIAGAVVILIVGGLMANNNVFSTGAKPTETIANTNEISSNEHIEMEKLTKDAFLKKVFNYEQNKDWKYEGELPCLIDFYADWCGPCKMVHPILVELSKEYEGKIMIYQIDTEAEQELAAAFGIRSIPSLLFCPVDGQPQMAQGALPKAALKRAIEDILLKQATNVAP
ncbi:MAG: thioredoxin [Cyclobacteriaceae bacterium]|nr:thioredoxin [Cyclobacteriaceae bacterium]